MTVYSTPPFPAATASALPQRIGVFGGAFDPPHNAHVALAYAALEQLQLCELHVIPTGFAWHKPRVLTAAEHRLAMARLAFEGMPRVLIDARELQRSGPTFTIDTLLALQSENPAAQLYLILGADQFLAFRKWNRWEMIFDIAIICVAERQSESWSSSLFDSFSEFKHRFRHLRLGSLDISATRVRQAAASGPTGATDVSRLVPDGVARYISNHRLYQTG